MFAYLHHNHFSTYLRNYSGISKLVIWSDGCGYQNKSAGIANSVLHLTLSVETNAPVQQKLLTPGHTQMDCGAMHSLVERKTKCDIFTPREDGLAMAMASEAPFPFAVAEVYYNKPRILPGDFLKSIPPGKERGDSTGSEGYTYTYAMNNDRTSKVKQTQLEG
ncbi:hypothetical protein PoB_006027500 [Plakobranchus ocellatus]|uniref:Uncharacterized protein n=1 Tax=Plakobranchus ocellatus TaxID=259542 RepID=A0AAV4CPL8_9GAST|nr:hypothetical protein PoB_006027500 [Plakobranchus ocellatus]